MTAASAALLGLVQGLTEFIPVSSKTHLVVVPAIVRGRKGGPHEFAEHHLVRLVEHVRQNIETTAMRHRGDELLAPE